jgi:hypothetical protein
VALPLDAVGFGSCHSEISRIGVLRDPVMEMSWRECLATLEKLGVEVANCISQLVESAWSRRASVGTADEFETEFEGTELEDSTNLIHSSNKWVN